MCLREQNAAAMLWFPPPMPETVRVISVATPFLVPQQTLQKLTKIDTSLIPSNFAE
jgi:hypothetical protein